MNDSWEEENLIVAIVGPTASGKSALAHKLALRLQTQIISADSRLIYKGMNIGTAKPSIQEQQEVNYHMIDLIEPPERFSLGQYIQQSLPITNTILQNKQLPLFVGGTGFYLKGLLQGLPLTNVAPNYELRAELDLLSNDELFQRLRTQDIKQKWKIHPNDRMRLIRALEIESLCESSQKEEKALRLPAKTLWIGLKAESLDSLRKRIEGRTQKMLKTGLIGEVESLLKEYGEVEIFNKTIGYKETIDFLKGQIGSLDELAGKISITSGQYAKRQMTWFRSNRLIKWFDCMQEEESLLSQVESFIARDFPSLVVKHET